MGKCVSSFATKISIRRRRSGRTVGQISDLIKFRPNLLSSKTMEFKIVRFWPIEAPSSTRHADERHCGKSDRQLIVFEIDRSP